MSVGSCPAVPRIPDIPPKPTGARSCGTLLRTPSLCRLNQPDWKLARWKKRNFTGSMIEIYVFNFRTEDFRGLNLSHRMVGPPVPMGLFPGYSQ